MAREAIARHALTCRFVCTHSCCLSDSTQLGNRTENSVERGAIATHDFKGRFVCIVVCSTPFSTSYMSNRTHCSHTHASWVIQPSYALGLKTVWKEEPLLLMISKVVLFVLLGVLRRFQPHVIWTCQITRTVHILVILPSYSMILNTLWQREQLPVLLSEVVLYVLFGVLCRFPHHSSHTTPSVHTLVIPGWINPAMR